MDYSYKQISDESMIAALALKGGDYGKPNVFKVLAEEQRRYILELLKQGKMSAGEISERLNISPAALSYHLKLLKEAGFVMEYKNKNYIYYEINLTVFEELLLWIKQFGGNEKWKKLYLLSQLFPY